MSQFRKKPVVIEATQWFKDGDHPAVTVWNKGGHVYKNGTPLIETLEGEHIVTPGDWIITGVKGEHYPCKPDIFAATYEAATDAASAEQASPAALSLDQLADDTLNRVAAFIGEYVGGDTFCGFSVDETRDENNLLLSLRLVPCDTVDGEPVRRVGR